MAISRSHKPSNLSYVELSSDHDMEHDGHTTDVDYADNEKSSSEGDYEPMSTPTKSKPLFKQAIRAPNFMRLPEYNDHTNIENVPIEDMIANFIDFHYSHTGRFDQHEIDEEHPSPTAPGALERLGIAATMVIYFREHPHHLKEIDPRNMEKSKPFSDGVPWCQFENACLVEEMCLFARTRGDSKIGGQTLMGKMADILNTKYGIGRSGTATKNQWYRFLRDRTGIDERGNFGASKTSNRHGGPLAVSIGGSRKSKVIASRVSRRKAASKRMEA